jgi:hypothetical protein
MKGAGTRPELILAYEKTGFFVNETGYKNMSPADRREYDAAIDEHFRLERKGR